MLNEDHVRNLSRRADSVAESIHRAWMHFQILQGMQEAAQRDRENLLAHPIAFDAIYRAVFEALYVAVGAVIDTRSDVESLHTLVKMARGYPVDRTVVKGIEKVLASVQLRDGSPIDRLRNWRDKHAAHKTLAAAEPAFYVENSLQLSEVERALTTLEQALTAITLPILGTGYELRPSTEKVAANCSSLLTRHAA